MELNLCLLKLSWWLELFTLELGPFSFVIKGTRGVWVKKGGSYCSVMQYVLLKCTLKYPKV